MVGVKTKPREQVGMDDIHELINSRVPEGEHIEFKETLPGRGNPWLNGGNSVGRFAKNKVLEESVGLCQRPWWRSVDRHQGG